MRPQILERIAANVLKAVGTREERGAIANPNDDQKDMSKLTDLYFRPILTGRTAKPSPLKKGLSYLPSSFLDLPTPLVLSARKL